MSFSMNATDPSVLGRLDGAGEGKDTDVDETPEMGLPGSGSGATRI
jgi:hypothetical protein